jgi:hypothetical protein
MQSIPLRHPLHRSPGLVLPHQLPRGVRAKTSMNLAEPSAVGLLRAPVSSRPREIVGEFCVRKRERQLHSQDHSVHARILVLIGESRCVRGRARLAGALAISVAMRLLAHTVRDDGLVTPAKNSSAND